MSEPVTNAEIEDVLSSIRRLVSEEPLRARKKPVSETGLDKLVLTPAFRVSEPAKAAMTPEPSAQPEPAPQPAEAQAPEPPTPAAEPQPDWQAEDDSYDLSELAGAAKPAEPEPVAKVAEPEVKEVGKMPAPEPAAGPMSEVADEDEDEGGPTPVATDKSRASPTETLMPELTLEQRIAELEAAINQSMDDWEPDGSEDGTSDETRPLSLDAASLAKATSDDESSEAPKSVDESVAVAAAETIKPPIVEDSPVELLDGDPSVADEPDEKADVAVPPEISKPETSVAVKTTDEDSSPIEDELTEVQVAAAEPEQSDEPQPEAISIAKVVNTVAPSEADNQFKSAKDPVATKTAPDTSKTSGTSDDAPALELTAEPVPSTSADKPKSRLQLSEPAAKPEPELERPQPSDDTEAANAEPERSVDPLEWTEVGTDTNLADDEGDQSADDDQIWDSVAASDADADADASENEAFDLLGGDLTIDEEALRELVSQMVRDELQGVLGERITRNVRRLVRREIQRAMALRDLE